MIRTKWTVIFIILTMLMAACGGNAETPAPESNTNSPPQIDEGGALESAGTAVPTYTAVPIEEVELELAYPAKQIPINPTPDPNYPGPPTMMPTLDPYPGGLVWIIRPAGIQCEQGTLPGYSDLSEAITTTTASGVKVKEAELIDIPVAQQCGQPTSTHYRLQIAAEDTETAVSTGWLLQQ